MAKILPAGQGRRTSALWVDSIHHTFVKMCARVMRTQEGKQLSDGQFVERAIDILIETEPSLESLRPVLAEMKLAFEATEKAIEQAQGRSGE